VVTLSTLHAAKGLEWPHVMLVGVTEGLLPFASEAEAMNPHDRPKGESPLGGVAHSARGASIDAARLEEERRLMYVGVTRARRTLAVSTLKRRKRGRELVAGQPSRFIAEMRLNENVARQEARERLKHLRAELAARPSRTIDVAT
jgi:ATP-dependent DNA helicase Rep